MKEHTVDRNKKIRGIKVNKIQHQQWDKNLGSKEENRTKNKKDTNRALGQKRGKRNTKATRRNKERIY